MTPFEWWYSTNIAATLPKDFPPQLAAQAKKSLAACWNAALDAVLNSYKDGFATIAEEKLRISALKVS
jgi:hypothetical protein